MGHIAAYPDRLAAPLVEAKSDSRAIPWYVWNFTAAALSVTIGGQWDISWHVSVGRDSFWTPAHMLIYLCGVLGGFGSAALILGTTFGRMPKMRASSVRMWGFRGPLGAFVAAWGGAAMLASAPFDDWWHNAYGLDVKVLSPPHVVLILGILAIKFGALLIVLGEMNRAEGARRTILRLFFLFLGTLLARDIVAVFALEFMQRTMQHSGRFFLVAAITVPLGHFAVARVLKGRFPLTAVSGLSFAISLAFLWILPLFPAEPKLGPVFQQVTHLIPMGGFPLLVPVAMLAADWLWTRLQGRNDWTLALILGPAFLAVFIAVQWPMADFLQSPAARNAFFGSHYLPYFTPPTSDTAMFRFTTAIDASAAQFWTRIALAFVFSILSVRAGLGLGSWMEKVQR
ncbi:MAG: hypothetical protein SFV18_07305 [Bryobacteraceae bacterium]|nr:hypothetical protein [Bryobacteraceae bacterium]